MSSRATAWLAWSVWGLSVTLVALSMILSWAVSAWSGITSGFVDVALLAFPTVGVLIVTRHPGNPIGWLLCAVGLTLAATAFANGYVAYALAGPGEPGHEWIAWVGNWIWLLGVGTILTFLLLLFPSGRLPSPRWRPIGWLAATGMATVVFGVAFMPGRLADYPAMINPLGLDVLEGSLLEGGGVGWGIFLASIVLSAASLVARFRRAGGIERQQIKWLAFAGVLMAVGWIFGFVYGSQGLPPLAVQLVLTASLVGMPTAIGIAILKHRLYNIDVVINRTLVYGALTACVVGVYVLVVGGVGALLQARGNLLLSILAAGLVAVLFAPLKEGLQRGVNRLMYGERDEPYKVLSRLGRRLEGALTPEAVLPAIVEDIARALRLGHVAIWLADNDTLRLGAAHGTTPPEMAVRGAGALEKLRRAPDGLGPEELSPSNKYGTVLVACSVGLVLPLTHQGELVGALCMAPRSPSETFSPADRLLLRDLAIQTGAAAHAVRLTMALRSSLEDLQRSREKLVAAQDEERRRIQRDLHDGLGPVLASMRLRLEACLDEAQETKDPLAGDLERLYELVGQATADIRRLVYDLRPPVLDQLGLVPALRQHCERFGRESGVEVRLEAEEGLSVPAAAEVALLRVVQEALVNVGNHARASRAEVRLARGDGWLELEVRDDGAGFGVNGDLPGGTGIGSMRERAELLGGTLRLSGGPGTGTRVTARIPVEGAAW